jgi:hypothetical protein
MFSGSSFDPVAGFQNSLNEALSDIGKAITDNIKSDVIAKMVIEVDDAAVSIAKSFGQGRENVLAMSQSMTAAYRDVVLLGGEFNDIANIQKDVSSTLGRNIILTSESYEGLYAASQVTEKSASYIVESFKNAGISAYQASTEMGKVVDIARASGVNAIAVSQKVLANMEALNQFNFNGGVEGLAKMATQATMLRIDMSKTLDLAEKLFDPEKAIDLAASMQRLGVANSELLDPLRLMDLAQNDPAELQNQIAKMTEQFVQLNEKGQFEIMPGAQRQLREISSALGIGYNELSKMAIGTKELDDKLSKINFAGLNFTEDQKMMIANMAEMGKDGQFKIQVEGKGEMDLQQALVEFERDPKLLEALEESAQPKTMEELAREQLKVSERIAANTKAQTVLPAAIAGTQTAKDALLALDVFTKELADITTGTDAMSIKNLTKGIGEGSTKILGDIENLVSGEGSLSDLLTSISDTGKKLDIFASDAAKQSLEKYEESLGDLRDANNQFVDIFLAAGGTIKNWFLKNENLGGGNVTVAAEDFIIKTLPEDEIRMVGGTNLDGNKNQSSTQTNSGPVDINLNMNVNVTAPPNIDTAQLVLALKDIEVSRMIVESIKSSVTDNNLLTTTANPQQQMAGIKNSMGYTGIPSA